MDNFYSRCLLCTCIPYVTPHLQIFSEAGNQLQLADKINKLLNIQIEAELPQNVCHSCMEKLEVTYELVTSSQQARIMLLQMKQQSENAVHELQVKRENSECSVIELDLYQASTVIESENCRKTKEDETTMDNTDSNFSSTDSYQSEYALQSTIVRTQMKGGYSDEVLTPEVEIEQHSIKLEPGEDPLDCLTQNLQTRDVKLENKLADQCQVLIPKLLECDLCCFYTNSKTQLSTHMQAHLSSTASERTRVREPSKCKDMRSSRMHCDQCGILFGHPEVMTWHNEHCHGADAIVRIINVTHKLHMYQCVFCETECKELRLMIQHLHSQHQVQNLPFKCKLCARQFIKIDHLNNHKCSKTIISCKTANGKSCLFKRPNMKNFGKTGVKCKLCNSDFESVKIMKKHVSSFHAIQRESHSHKCLHCDETFKYFPYLESHCHTKHHGKRILQCDICKMEFFSQTGYRWHIKSKHAALFIPSII